MAITYSQPETAPIGKRAATGLRTLLGRQEVVILLLTVVLTLFFYSRNPAMLTPTVWIGILRTMAFPALIAMGMVQLMIAGEIDLSTGAMMSLAAVFTAKMVRDLGVSLPLAVLIALLASALVGLTNALLSVKVGIPAIITTIAMSFIVRGASYSFTNGLPIYPLPKEVGIIGSWRPLNLSFTFWLAVGVMIISQILITRTRWGSAIFATGANRTAAEVCGINTARTKTICFILTSLLAGMAGLLTMSQLPQTPGDPIIGRELEFTVLVGVIIGGVSFYGGRGSALGAFIGVFFIQVVRSGLVIARFDSFLQTPVLGFLLVVAAVVDVLRHRRDEG
jgi:ribose transport system permease protein